jgi:hypothetical protein
MGDAINFKPSGRQEVRDTTGKPMVSRELPADWESQESMNSAKSALSLKIAGASYFEIAQTLDYKSPTDARIAVERMLAASLPAEVDYSGLRHLANARLDALLRSVAPRGMNPKDPDHISYARMVLSVVDRQIKLNGLDAPQVHLINPGGDELTKYVEAMAEVMGAEKPVEGDIFALEEGPSGTWGPEDDDE